MHAEICYAECLLQKATLTFVQVSTFPKEQHILLRVKRFSLQTPTSVCFSTRMKTWSVSSKEASRFEQATRFTSESLISASLTLKCQVFFQHLETFSEDGECVCVSSIRDCQNVLNGAQGLAGQSDSFRQFEGGVKLGIGSFNLVGFFFFFLTVFVRSRFWRMSWVFFFF